MWEKAGGWGGGAGGALPRADAVGGSRGSGEGVVFVVLMVLVAVAVEERAGVGNVFLLRVKT